MRVEAVRLVAARELRVRARSRAFQVSTGISIAMVALLLVIPTLRGDEPAFYDVVTVGVAPEIAELGVQEAANAVGAGAGATGVADVASAERAVASGEADAAIIDGAVVVRRTPGRGETSRTALFAQALSRSVADQLALAGLGVDPAVATAALRRPPLVVRGLEAPRTDERERVTALAGIVLLFFQLVQYSNWVITGVVEEKASRIVEVLLCTMKPVELLTGKVLGIGVLALGHSLALLSTALGVSLATGSDVLSRAAWTSVLASAGWFVLGYAFSCTLNAAAGSLVSRQEDAQSVIAPIMVPMMVGYITATTVLASGEVSTLARVLAYVPMTAPFCMPALIAAGAVGPTGVAVAVVLMVVAIVAGARLASGVYTRSILRTGKRVPWREALRTAPG